MHDCIPTAKIISRVRLAISLLNSKVEFDKRDIQRKKQQCKLGYVGKKVRLYQELIKALSCC